MRSGGKKGLPVAHPGPVQTVTTHSQLIFQRESSFVENLQEAHIDAVVREALHRVELDVKGIVEIGLQDPAEVLPLQSVQALGADNHPHAVVQNGRPNLIVLPRQSVRIARDGR